MFKGDRGDIILSLAAFFQIVVLMLQQLLVESNIAIHESIRVISIIISALPMIPAIYFIINRRLSLLIITYYLISLIIISTLSFFTENEQYLSAEIFYLLGINIPSFLCLASIRDKSILKQVLVYLSFVIFVFGLVYFYFLWNGRIVFDRYSMPFGYYILLPALVFVNQRKLIFTILFLVICVMMLLIGSRGPLVAAVSFAFISMYINKASRKYILLLTCGLIILYGSFHTLLYYFSDILGITSRSLDFLEYGGFIQSEDRVGLYSIIWNDTLTHPLFGHGIYSDRVLLDGAYCHNLFLELLHNFGLLFGSGLILLLFSKLIKVYFSSDNENKRILLMLLCYSLIPLMVSKSYLNDPSFGILIGSLFPLSKNDFPN